MNKDELIGYIKHIKRIAEKELDNATERIDITYWGRRVERIEAICKIINQHYSITEQERKEVVEWLEIQTRDFLIPNKTRRTILKALGELK